MSLLDDKDFKIVTSCAKAVVKACKGLELAVSHMQIALLLSARAHKLKALKKLSVLQATLCEKAAKDLGYDLSKKLAPPKPLKLPLAESFRTILSQTKNGSFLQFVDALLDTKAEKSKEETQPKATAKDDSHYAKITLCAHSVAERFELKEMTAELFTTGAVVAHRGGMLADRPSLLHSIITNDLAIEYLLRERGWDVTGLAARKTTLDLPHHETFKKAIDDSADHNDPLLALVNRGILVGVSIRQKERVAYHEAGHAVVCLLIQPNRDISEVTIVSKGDEAGYVSYEKSSSWMNIPFSKESVLDELCVSLAGRVSEQRKAGYSEGTDDGATSDLRQATDMAWKAITEWGMDDEFGPVVLETCIDESGLKSGWLFDEAQRRLQIIMKEANARTENLVKTNWHHIETLAKSLLHKPRMTEDEVLAILPELIKR